MYRLHCWFLCHKLFLFHPSWHISSSILKLTSVHPSCISPVVAIIGNNYPPSFLDSLIYHSRGACILHTRHHPIARVHIDPFCNIRCVASFHCVTCCIFDCLRNSFWTHPVLTHNAKCPKRRLNASKTSITASHTKRASVIIIIVTLYSHSSLHVFTW